MNIVRPINKTVDTGLGIITNYYGSKIDLYGKQAEKVIKDVADRVNIPKQFMKFVDLPSAQLDRIDEMYRLAALLKKNSKAKFLTVAGIGGSKHPVEHMLSINGLNIDKSVKFFSDIDTVSINRFMKEIGGDIRNSNYLIVSKSGKTFETKDALDQIEGRLIKAYVDEGYSVTAAVSAAAKHFVAVTDKQKGDLRPYAQTNNWIGNLLIHDDVGGRFSAFDDHVLFTLAYAGMKKDNMTRMLSAASKMSDLSLNPDLTKNDPLSQAFHWVINNRSGKNRATHQYMGSMFKDTVNFHTQMEYESVKVPDKQIVVVPEGMHHSSEMYFDKRLKYVYALTSPMDKGFAKDNVNRYTRALNDTYQEFGPYFNERVEVADMGLTPEAAGAMTQSRNMSTVFQEVVNDVLDGINVVKKRLESVFQDNVETYKKNLR